jgi:superkiller protein 3
MRPNGHVTAVLLLVTFAAVGCSKRGEAPQTKAQERRDSAQAKPVAAPGTLDRQDEEGFGEDATAKISGPVSFADAEAAYQAKNYSEAAKLFERYAGQRPGNAWGHFMLGLSAWKGGDLTKAEGAFEKALSIDPNHVKSLVNLSRVLIDQNRIDDALVTLTHAGDIDPKSTDVQRLLGRAYQAQGKTDEAVDAYRRAIALDARDVWSMNNLGLLLLEQHRADEALPLFAKAVELRQDVPAFYNNLGMALEHTGRFVAAAAAYRGALTADPGYGKAGKNLARVEAVKGDREEPFDLEATATRSVEDSKSSSDETIAGR